MAPRTRARGRPRKPRESRMDAAVDAMKPYGFPEKLVMKSVKYLIDLYGGSEVWPVIEDGYYAILLDYLLKESEENGGDDQNKSNDPEGSNNQESASEGGNHEGSNNQESASEVVNNATVLAQENGSENTTPNATMEPICNDIEPRSDITDTSSIPENTGTEVSQRGNANLETANINSDVNHGNTVVNSTLAIIAPRSPAGIIRKPRRRPCYGWITDDEDDDFIFLVPEEALASPKEPKTLRRRSRWDVRPDDI